MSEQYVFRMPYDKEPSNGVSYKWLIIGIVIGIVIGAGVFFAWGQLSRDGSEPDGRLATIEKEKLLARFGELHARLNDHLSSTRRYLNEMEGDSPDKIAVIDRLDSELKAIEDEYRSLEQIMADMEKREIADLRDSYKPRKKKLDKDRKPADREPKASKPPQKEPVAQVAQKDATADRSQASVRPAAQSSEGSPEKTGSSPQDRHIVKGRVVDINGNPQPGIEITIDEKYSGVSNENGEYTIERVPEGVFSLTASNGDHGPIDLPLSVDRSQEIVEDIIYPEAVRQFLICKSLVIQKNEDNRTEWKIDGVGEEFEGGVGRLTCLTRIVGAKQRLTVKHRWFWSDQLMTEIPLEIKSSNWRTYSKKTINRKGPWRVDVVRAADGKLLASKSFSVN